MVHFNKRSHWAKQIWKSGLCNRENPKGNPPFVPKHGSNEPISLHRTIKRDWPEIFAKEFWFCMKDVSTTPSIANLQPWCRKRISSATVPATSALATTITMENTLSSDVSTQHYRYVSLFLFFKCVIMPWSVNIEPHLIPSKNQLTQLVQ